MHIDEKLRQALELIKARLRETGVEPNADDEAATRWSILAHATCLEAGVVVVTPQALGDCMASYAAHVLSGIMGGVVTAHDLGDGSLVFRDADGETILETGGAGTLH